MQVSAVGGSSADEMDEPTRRIEEDRKGSLMIIKVSESIQKHVVVQMHSTPLNTQIANPVHRSHCSEPHFFSRSAYFSHPSFSSTSTFPKTSCSSFLA